MSNIRRRDFLKTVGLGVLASAGAKPYAANAAPDKTQAKRNVLFITVDDLRPELGCYGRKHIHSPNIDALAKRGLLFGRAYAQQALCGPSRNSVFSGCRPDTTKVYGNAFTFRKHCPDIVALGQLFKNHGYHTQGFGKILHHDGQDDPVSWTEPRWSPAFQEGMYAHPDNRDCKITMDRAANFENPLTECADVPDNAYKDGMICDRAITALRRVKDPSTALGAGTPFFLAVGFFKPHTPFNAPKKYWDLYRRDEIKLTDNPDRPLDAPDIAMNDFRYVRSFKGLPKSGPVPDALAREIRHAYYACVSYVDAQVGRLLAELKRLGLADNTVVLLWGDHGYQLGDHGMWCKHTNFETSTHAPLILHVPGQSNPGARTDALVEMVDIYPTLADACSLPLPDHLEGTSTLPLMENPKRPWKSAAFSQYRRGAMGRSIRTDRYRYNEWIKTAGAKRTVVARELYDHKTDPKESINLASRPANAQLVKDLSAKLRAGWKAALPKKTQPPHGAES